MNLHTHEGLFTIPWMIAVGLRTAEGVHLPPLFQMHQSIHLALDRLLDSSMSYLYGVSSVFGPPSHSAHFDKILDLQPKHVLSVALRFSTDSSDILGGGQWEDE